MVMVPLNSPPLEDVPATCSVLPSCVATLCGRWRRRRERSAEHDTRRLVREACSIWKSPFRAACDAVSRAAAGAIGMPRGLTAADWIPTVASDGPRDSATAITSSCVHRLTPPADEHPRGHGRTIEQPSNHDRCRALDTSRWEWRPLACLRDACGTSIAWWSALSLLPDADVIGFALGVEYGDPWGHRVRRTP